MFDKLSLKTIRIERGFEQRVIAKKLGITPATLCYYESGKRNIKQKHLDKLLKIYNVSYNDIFFKTKSTDSKKSTK